MTSNRRGGSPVRLEGLGKRYGDVWAVEPLDLAVGAGELLVLLGPSGCGKTTVLRMIAGLEEPAEGKVWIGGERVDDRPPAERNIAMVFQNYALYPHMTVRENLSFGLRTRKVDRGAIRRRVERAAGILGLGEMLERRPGQLSGGQKQRVALGRALVREPAVFLFDEPLSNLDASLRVEMRGQIAELHDRLGATMLYVTHDQVEAMTLGDRIAVMREGRLQQCAAPLDIYGRPANLFVARFVGTPSINTLPGELVSPAGSGEGAGEGGGRTRFCSPELSVETGLETGERSPRRAVLGVRPEELELVEPGSPEGGDGAPRAHLETRIRRLEPLGSEILVHLEGPGEEGWVARIAPDRRVGEGEPARVRLRPGRFHLFDADTGERLVRAEEDGAPPRTDRAPPAEEGAPPAEEGAPPAEDGPG